MTYTSHGHYIEGTINTVGRPDTRTRCGGPGMCAQCSKEAQRAKPDVSYPVVQELGPVIPESEWKIGSPEDFQLKAKRIVTEYIDRIHAEWPGDHEMETFEVYVVWFAKTLQNWKALVSTDLSDGMYYEVTYNGDKCETYLDQYEKRNNVVIPDPQREPFPALAAHVSEHHDDQTLFKAHQAILNAGLEFGARESGAVLNSLLNAGILFRERT
jgi:hypothetical protein